MTRREEVVPQAQPITAATSREDGFTKEALSHRPPAEVPPSEVAPLPQEETQFQSLQMSYTNTQQCGARPPILPKFTLEVRLHLLR